MAWIGIHVSAKPLKNPNIEDVLISASLEGLSNEDWRTLSLTVDWIFKHSAIINVDRLTRAITELKENTLLVAFWSSIAKNIKSNIRFKRLALLPNQVQSTIRSHRYVTICLMASLISMNLILEFQTLL